MEKNAVFNGVLDLISSSDLGKYDIDVLFEKIRPQFEILARSFHAAKISVHFKIEPNVYMMEGYEKNFESACHNYIAAETGALRLSSDLGGHAFADSLICPIEGYSFTSEEEYELLSVLKLTHIGLSRCTLLKYQAKAPYIDVMTGLANNQGIGYYGAEIESKYAMEDYAACCINLKNFKYINQHMGTQIADDVIRQYASNIFGYADRKKELVARIGGDEFFALVHKDNLERFLDRASAVKIVASGGSIQMPVPVGARIGVYRAEKGATVQTMLSKSTFAIEQARNSRLTISYFNQGQMDMSVYSKQVVYTLPEAIRERELKPFYQPKVYLDDGRLCGCEALVRWIHDGVTIPPSEFIPVAESNGLITSLDLYMLEEVCKDIRNWLDRGIEPVCVSINYSQQDFYRDTLIEDTLNILNRYGIEGKYLEIEITESSFLERFEALDDFVKTMHENGIKVSLDDFGTGYSSLTMFKNLNLDTVKLDKSLFSNQEDQSQKSYIILRSIADMISQLNTITVAEGIETPEQLKLVHDIGGHVVQGFIFDRPLEYDEFTQRLISRHYES